MASQSVAFHLRSVAEVLGLPMNQVRWASSRRAAAVSGTVGVIPPPKLAPDGRLLYQRRRPF